MKRVKSWPPVHKCTNKTGEILITPSRMLFIPKPMFTHVHTNQYRNPQCNGLHHTATHHSIETHPSHVPQIETNHSLCTAGPSLSHTVLVTVLSFPSLSFFSVLLWRRGHYHILTITLGQPFLPSCTRVLPSSNWHSSCDHKRCIIRGPCLAEKQLYMETEEWRKRWTYHSSPRYVWKYVLLQRIYK